MHDLSQDIAAGSSMVLEMIAFHHEPRNLILQALSWDYQVRVNGNVIYRGSPDCVHYLEMHDILRKIRSIHGRAHLTSYGRSALAPYFWKFLHAPCKSLGIPVESAIEIVLRHARYFGSNRSYPSMYSGCIDGVIRDYGMQKLAEKLWMDQNILIPRVATSDEMRLNFAAGIKRATDEYFVSIQSGGSPGIVPNDMQSHSPAVSYTLNYQGRAFEETRQAAIRQATDPTAPLVEEVRMCMCILGRDLETVEPPPRKLTLFANKINSYM